MAAKGGRRPGKNPKSDSNTDLVTKDVIEYMLKQAFGDDEVFIKRMKNRTKENFGKEGKTKIKRERSNEKKRNIEKEEKTEKKGKSDSSKSKNDSEKKQKYDKRDLKITLDTDAVFYLNMNCEKLTEFKLESYKQIKQFQSMDTDLKYTLRWLCRNILNVELIKYLVEHEKIEITNINQLIKMAIQYNNLEVIKYLISIKESRNQILEDKKKSEESESDEEDDSKNSDEELDYLMDACTKSAFPEVIDYFINETKKDWGTLYKEYYLPTCQYNINLKVIKHIMEKFKNKAEMHYKTETGTNAFLKACKNNNVEIPIYFVEELNFDLDYKNKFGCNGLTEAAKYNNDDTFEYLVNKGINMNAKMISKTVCEFICKNNLSLKRLQIMMGSGKVNIDYVNKYNENYFMVACHSKNMDEKIGRYFVEDLKFKERLDEENNDEGLNCLTILCRHYPTIDLVKYFVEQCKGKISINSKKIGIYMSLIGTNEEIDKAERFEIFEYLGNEKGKILTNTKKAELLLNQCEMDEYDMKIIDYLVKDLKAPMQGYIGYKFNSFLNACRKGDVELVKYLVEAKANINAKSDSGESSIYYACGNSKNGLEIIKYLRKRKELKNHGNAEENMREACARTKTSELIEYLAKEYRVNVKTVKRVNKKKRKIKC